VALLKAAGYVNKNSEETVVLGELSLDGKIRSVSGVLPMAIEAKNKGIRELILPSGNVHEASYVDGLSIYGFQKLDELLKFLQGELVVQSVETKKFENLLNTPYRGPDFKDVINQKLARRCIEIAAAGMHNVLMIGPPGSGKTMIAKRVPGILPELQFSEALETTKIHSVAGILKRKRGLVVRRPFVSPHHTASDVAIIGGTKDVIPGLVSLAHNGILFLDEFLEFKRSVLEVLRQPLEEGYVTISRAGKTMQYPAKFMLIAACNPCPCGYLWSKKRECTCSQAQISKYQSKLSGPLIDRIDIHIKMEEVDLTQYNYSGNEESSDIIRQRISKAHDIQKERFNGFDFSYNAHMSEEYMRENIKLNNFMNALLEKINNNYGLSARSISKIIKVARTIADLDSAIDIKDSHILEAVKLRYLDTNQRFQ
jgi:magnesium chelatase family protein